MTLIIGLTGGIGSGKSTVSRFFAKLGVVIVDADIVARQVVQKGQPALQKIAEHFGHHILIDGHLNRALLREFIFNNEADKKWLNELLHPLIRQEILAQLQQANGHYVILEAPLLFENKLELLTDYDLVIDVQEAIQIQRASQRDGVSKEAIKAVINSQIDRQQRLQKTDYCIDNSRLSVSDLQDSVQQLHAQFMQLEKCTNINDK